MNLAWFDDEDLPCAIDTQRTPIELAQLEDHPRFDRDKSEKAIARLQTRLVLLHQAGIRHGRRAMLVFEGMDAAGKGGIIRRMDRALDPHHAHVWPIAAPQYEERDHHYLYRFWKRLPVLGEIAIYDRSWYGRVLVERVERLASRREWQRAYAEIKDFERVLHDDGIRIVKMLLHVTRDEQESRFRDRMCNPAKRFKLTVSDFRARRHWEDYQLAFQDMLEQTSTAHAPWFLIPANSKPFARVAALRRIVEILGEEIDTDVLLKLPAEVRKAAEATFGKDVVAEALDED